MAERGTTPGELRWPDSDLFAIAAAHARAGAFETLLSAMWRGYDSFLADGWSNVDLAAATDEVERSLTQYLVPHIRLDEYSPFFLYPGFKELASRQAPPAQAPEYDIAFVLRANQRIAWPVEAKVLSTSGTVAEYNKAVKERFLTGYYAPFTPSAAMVGYLMGGATDDAFASISAKLPATLVRHDGFVDRPHRISDHERTWPDDDSRPKEFRCHHLLFVMQKLNS